MRLGADVCLANSAQEEEKVSASDEDSQGVPTSGGFYDRGGGTRTQSEAESRGPLLLLLLFHHVFLFFSSLTFFPFNV